MNAETKTVLMLLSNIGNLAIKMLPGVQRVAIARRWEFFAVFCDRLKNGAILLSRSPGGASIPELMQFLKPDGCIFATGDLPIDQVWAAMSAGRARIPIVRLNRDADEKYPGSVEVHGDSVSFAEMAARELLRSGYSHYAFAPWHENDSWNRERHDAFRHFVTMAGQTFHQFPRQLTLSDTAHLADIYAPWLESLPKPCGIFAANDTAGESVLWACSRVGIAVPAQIGVCGVDNLESICEYTRPTLSSIRRDLETEGRVAAELLAEWMGHPSRPPKSRVVPGLSLVRRASTRFYSLRDWRVAEAQEWIRLHGCEEGVTPRRVVAQMKVSRTTADRLFRSTAGHSILSEIQGVRMERAMEMLRAGKPADIVAAECGFASTLDFRRVFRRIVGVPVVAWAKRQ
ncbi:MAG: substrate-binding domain-containing protein [Kiritimatiellae bacterium]|nr:substrate-binding domain-containing protein [Kiritimatiellia bacterium]